MAHVSNSWIRWTAPAGAVVLVAAGSALLSSRADAKPADLPPRTAQELIADVVRAGQNTAAGGGPVGMSGTVVQTTDLGLPEVQGVLNGSKSSGELTSIIAGSHTWRVWYAGPEKVRLALLGTGSESDVIRNGKDVWIWSSGNKSATHHTMPTDLPTGKDAKSSASDPAAAALSADPAELAREVLARVGSNSTVSDPDTVSVAGRSAYELSVSPKTSGSLIKSVKIAVDAEYKVPLRVQVTSVRKTDPAIEVAFTDVDFTKPEDRQFQFTPPPGTEVKEGSSDATPGAPSAPSGSSSDSSSGAAAPSAGTSDDAGKKTSGTDWTTVVVQSAPTGSESGPSSESSQLVGQLMAVGTPVSGTWGSGRMFRGTVFTVLWSDDGRIAYGAVQPELLFKVLAAK